MRLLLDANVLYWSVFDRASLTPKVRAALEDEANELLVSHGTLWELSLKTAKGNLPMPDSSIGFLLAKIKQIRMTQVPIEVSDILRTEQLPMHHRDPFDRLLVAQAMERNLTIASSDGKIPLYAVEVIWK